MPEFQNSTQWLGAVSSFEIFSSNVYWHVFLCCVFFLLGLSVRVILFRLEPVKLFQPSSQRGGKKRKKKKDLSMSVWTPTFRTVTAKVVWRLPAIRNQPVLVGHPFANVDV